MKKIFSNHISIGFKNRVMALLFALPVFAFAQDPTFTQFYSNPLYLNPALAGATGCLIFLDFYII